MESTVLPSGKYTLVGIDVDTTGRRLIDEVGFLFFLENLIEIFYLDCSIGCLHSELPVRPVHNAVHELESGS